MSKRKRCSVDVRENFLQCAEATSLLVEGVFLFLRDHKCTAARVASPAYKVKGSLLCAVRLLNKEFHDEVDRRVRDWMKQLLVLLRDFREKNLAILVDESRMSAKHEAAKALATFARPMLGNVADCMAPELCARADLCFLGEDVGTFIAMLTQRCQMHAPTGNGVCRNCPNGNSSNFTLITFGDNRRTVYAREKCVEALSVKPNARFLSHATDTVFNNTVKALFRLKRVCYPFSWSEVSRATGGWGSRLASTGKGGHVLIATSLWPTRVLMQRHPAIDDQRASLQQLMGLSDVQVRQCKRDAERKGSQKEERERLRLKRIADELCEDMDQYLADDENDFPQDARSLAQIGAVWPGMAQSMRIAASRDKSASHALDVFAINNGLSTMKTFLGPVRAQEEKAGSVCSTTAYEFVSGLHVGRYDTIVPNWMPSYGSLNGGVVVKDPKHASLAMKFFDALDESSLVVACSRSDGLPTKWSLATRHMVVYTEARLLLDSHGVLYPHVKALDSCVRHMLAEHRPTLELPPLFDKATHNNSVSYLGTQSGMRASETVKKWYIAAFKLLVRDPITRCAALDLIGTSPRSVIDRASEIIDGKSPMSLEDRRAKRVVIVDSDSE